MKSIQEERAIRELKILNEGLRVAIETVDAGDEYIDIKTIVKDVKDSAVKLFEANYGSL